MKNDDDFDPEFYGPKPDAEKAAAIAIVLGIGVFILCLVYALARWVYHYFW